jgi:transcriptional regulator with XRE-family HTH domain
MKSNVIDQLRKAVKDSGESQLAIAEATGINQGNLSKFLRGERSLSLESFALLCQHLKLALVAK